MSPIDLSYAKDGSPAGKEVAPVVCAVHARGWGWGWAMYQNDQPFSSGFFRVPDHIEGQALSHARKCIGAFQEMIGLAEKQRFQVLVTESRDKTAPASSLLPVLSVLIGARYFEVEKGWLDELGMNRKELGRWATVVTGKPVEDESITLALGIGSWFVRRARLAHGALG